MLKLTFQSEGISGFPTKIKVVLGAFPSSHSACSLIDFDCCLSVDRIVNSHFPATCSFSDFQRPADKNS